MPDRPTIPFFIDQNVPDAVGRELSKAGHGVTRLRDVMASNTEDPIIAAACSRSGQVLVSHDSDFREIAKRLQITQKQTQRTLHRVYLRCPEPKSAGRILQAMSLIEHEWVLLQDGSPLHIEIREHAILTHR